MAIHKLHSEIRNLMVSLGASFIYRVDLGEVVYRLILIGNDNVTRKFKVHCSNQDSIYICTYKPWLKDWTLVKTAYLTDNATLSTVIEEITY